MRLTERGLTGALYRYQLMANIVGVLVIPLFVFFFLSLGLGGFKIELAILGVAHGYLYVVYLIAAGHLALKARLHVEDGKISPRGVGWIILMFGAGLVPGLTFVVEWLVVTRKIHPLLAAPAAGAEPGVSPVAR
jgi:hypothetical protein